MPNDMAADCPKGQSPEDARLQGLKDFYDKRFARDAYDLTAISEDESRLIRQLVDAALTWRAGAGDDSRLFTLIDFGCGEGRLHPLYEDISSRIKEDGWRLAVIAIDPARNGLDTYFAKCTEAGYRQCALGPDLGIPQLASDLAVRTLKKQNIEVVLVCADVEILARWPSVAQRVDVLISAGVICHILGSANRKTLLRSFQSAAASLFVSQPTTGDFPTLQSDFQDMRAARRRLLEALKRPGGDGGDPSRLQTRLAELDGQLGDALEEGEIYYSAGRVRNLGEKLPEYSSMKLPYFGTSVNQAKAAVESAGYPYAASVRAAFGNHWRWIATLASDYFEVAPLLRKPVDMGRQPGAEVQNWIKTEYK